MNAAAHRYVRLSDPAGTLPADAALRWPAEPALGAWYTEAEVDACCRALRESMDVRVGFRAHDEVEALEQEFAAYVGARHAVALNGGGTAIDLVLKAIGVTPSCEVVACAANFHGTHLSILGQTPGLVLAEAEPLSMTLDPADLPSRLSPRTKAIVVTHLHGRSADMDAILAEAARAPSRPKVIIDAARALGATYRGKRVGAIGDATIFSLQSKKHITALGEGGIVTTNDADLATTLREYRSFGMSSGWGSNYKMTKVQAAVARVQLRRLDTMNETRIRLAERRTRRLVDVLDWQFPAGTPDWNHVYYIYPILLPSDWDHERRDRLIRCLGERFGLGCVVANPPTYEYNAYVRERVHASTPRTSELASRLFCPSFHPTYSEAEEEEIALALESAVRKV